MFTQYTFQDWEAAQDKLDFLRSVISAYQASADFKDALTGYCYAVGENTAVDGKIILKADAVTLQDERGVEQEYIRNKEIIGNRIGTGFFKLATIQQNQYLLGNGVTLADNEQKKRLGASFDTTMAMIGWYSLMQGVCWGFWNADHLEVIEAAKDAQSGFVALLDEMTGAPRLGVQFWRVTSGKPMGVRLFEEDGLTVYREDSKTKKLEEAEAKRAYKQVVSRDAVGTQIIGSENYSSLPVIPFYPNPEHKSELTPNIKRKIDAYDNILSDFGDNLDRANDVYWVLNNFGGNTREVARMIQQINQLKAVINQTDGTGSATAEPHTIEVPYEARKVALEILRKELYADYMALDMDALTGGSLTNVAIECATANLNLKADRYEWKAFSFVQNILRLLGVETEDISFKRQSISNASETVDDLVKMRGDIDRRTFLEKNPYINSDEIEGIMQALDAEEVSGLSDMGALNNAIQDDAE